MNYEKSERLSREFVRFSTYTLSYLSDTKTATHEKKPMKILLITILVPLWSPMSVRVTVIYGFSSFPTGVCCVALFYHFNQCGTIKK